MSGLRTATVDGLTFSEAGWTSPEGYTLWLDDLPGWDTGPGVRRDRTPRAWTHGEFSERGLRDGRLLTIQGDAHCPTETVSALAAQRLAAVLADGGEGLIVVTDTATVDMSVVGSLIAEPKIGWKNDTTLTFLLQFLATDPRKYGAKISDTTAVAVPGDGLAWDLFATGTPGILDFGAAGDPGTNVLTNVGTADTAVVHTLTGSIPNGFTIRNTVTGYRLVWDGVLAAGQSLVLDSADGTVTLDGYADRSTQLVRREWERLARATTGVWLLEAPGSTGALLKTEVSPAWW